MLDVAVVGSLNHDLTVLTPHLPVPGETVLGRGHRSGPGGKGANQAVAAARLGSRTALIGRVGDDEHGRSLVSSLAREDIDVRCVGTDESEPTGLAVITVDDHAENSIVVSPGANMNLRGEDVDLCAELLADATVVLIQLEVPLEAVDAVAGIASGVLCLNPAPARPLPQRLMDRVDVLIPNRSELASLASSPVSAGTASIASAARTIEGPGAVVVTLGAEGSLVVEPDLLTAVPAPEVDAVDTVGAGDAFCGALANGISRGLTLGDAARWATVAGSLAAARPGALAAMPSTADMEAHFAE